MMWVDLQILKGLMMTEYHSKTDWYILILITAKFAFMVHSMHTKSHFLWGFKKLDCDLFLMSSYNYME